MASTGFLICTAASDDATSGTTAWITVSNATASDGADAVSANLTTAESHYLLCDFTGAFTIPIDSTIMGIEIRVEADTTGLNNQDLIEYRLHNGTTFFGTADSTVVPIAGAGDANYDRGGVTDLWGLTTLTLTPAIVNGIGVGIRTADNLPNGSGLANVDSVAINVHFSPPPGGGRAARSAGGLGIGLGFD